MTFTKLSQPIFGEQDNKDFMLELGSLQGLQDRVTIDTSEGKPVYLIAIGLKPTYLRLSATSYYLLEQRSHGASFESIAQTFCQLNRSTSPAEIETAYLKVCSQIAEIEQRSLATPSAYLFELPLLPKTVVRKIAAIGSLAFTKPAIYSLVVFVTISIAVWPWFDRSFLVDTTNFGWSYLLLMVSVMMHELGHASACARYGASPSTIGFTVYLIWPAFYSDVSDAWRLKRWQRVVVDISGVFFQIVTAAAYVFIYRLTNWSPIPLAIVMIMSSCLFNLNPFFKFDGYWILADILGVTNLNRHKTEILRHLFRTLRYKSVETLTLAPSIVSCIAVYGVLSSGIWLYLLYTFLPYFFNVLLNYPGILTHAVSDIIVGTPFLEIKSIQSLFNSTFVLLMGTLMIIRLIKLVSTCIYKNRSKL
jgi:putative peptide zinc metalloprotease protein